LKNVVLFGAPGIGGGMGRGDVGAGEGLPVIETTRSLVFAR
jgi:hypothetical protein